MALVRFACLAASKRPGGFCVAGKDIETGRWVRPLTDKLRHFVPEERLRLPDGGTLGVGDVIEVDLGAPHPLGCQTENRLDNGRPWARAGRISWQEAIQLLDEPEKLWENGSNTWHGFNDEMTEAMAKTYDHSLALIRINSLVIWNHDEGYNRISYKRRCKFQYRGCQYKFAVTDTAYDIDKGSRVDIDEALICCSVAEPIPKHGREGRFAYKLAAAIITPERLA